MSRLTLNSFDGFGATKGKHRERLPHSVHIPRDESLWERPSFKALLLLLWIRLYMLHFRRGHRGSVFDLVKSLSSCFHFPLSTAFSRDKITPILKLFLNAMLNGSLLLVKDTENTLSGHEAILAIYWKCPLIAYSILSFHSTLEWENEYNIPRSIPLSKSSDTPFPFPLLQPHKLSDTHRRSVWSILLQLPALSSTCSHWLWHKHTGNP